MGKIQHFEVRKTMERSTIFKFGKPSISMGHFPWLCDNFQRVETHTLKDQRPIFWSRLVRTASGGCSSACTAPCYPPLVGAAPRCAQSCRCWSNAWRCLGHGATTRNGGPKTEPRNYRRSMVAEGTKHVTLIYQYVYIYIYVCVCVYIYIYIEREREREGKNMHGIGIIQCPSYVARKNAYAIQCPRKKVGTLWWTNIAMERSIIFHGKIHYFHGHFPLLC